jgi:hypothetical protein
MKVGLYSDHHNLPFNDKGTNPHSIYDSNGFDDWVCEKHGKLHPASTFYLMPVLNGLNAINLPGLMAHVSVITDPIGKIIRSSKRVWVQITTSPVEDELGFPCVIRDNEIQARLIWNGCDQAHIYTPYDMLQGSGNIIDTPEFWKEFFLAELRNAKNEAYNRLVHLQAEVAAAEIKREVFDRINI